MGEGPEQAFKSVSHNFEFQNFPQCSKHIDGQNSMIFSIKINQPLTQHNGSVVYADCHLC
jgi:hypothetical protein